jgi:CTP:molybdopterin cytidylyltransferase MocA
VFPRAFQRALQIIMSRERLVERERLRNSQSDDDRKVSAYHVTVKEHRSNHLNPFVSIITVSLNAAATIEDTLVSVLLQRRSFEIEHICVDGGSTDRTRHVVDAWAGRAAHIRRIYEGDHGIFDAMNKGLGAATGEYVLFLNADDFLVAPDTLARAMEAARPGGDANPDLIAGDVSMGILGGHGLWRHRRAPRLLARVHGSGLFPIQQGLFAKRRVLADAGGFDARLQLGSDVNLFYDLERKVRPSTHLLRADVAFMRAGGASNAGLWAVWLGTREIYAHLAPTHGVARAAIMVLVKTLQSVSELRYGRCPHGRWFAASCADGSVTQ